MSLKVLAAWILIAALVANMILVAVKAISNQLFWINLIILAGLSYLGFRQKRK